MARKWEQSVRGIGTINLDSTPSVQSTPQGAPELYWKQSCCQGTRRKTEPIREIITSHINCHPDIPRYGIRAGTNTGMGMFSIWIINKHTWCLISELAASPRSKDTIMNFREMIGWHYAVRSKSMLTKETWDHNASSTLYITHLTSLCDPKELRLINPRGECFVLEPLSLGRSQKR